MEERITEAIDWSRAPADTPVCEAKGIYLRDIVQSILDAGLSSSVANRFLPLMAMIMRISSA